MTDKEICDFYINRLTPEQKQAVNKFLQEQLKAVNGNEIVFSSLPKEAILSEEEYKRLKAI